MGGDRRDESRRHNSFPIRKYLIASPQFFSKGRIVKRIATIHFSIGEL